MEIITSLEQLHKFSAPCVVALGTFDGLHRGHLDVIETARRRRVNVIRSWRYLPSATIPLNGFVRAWCRRR